MNTTISLSIEHVQKVKELIAEAIIKLRKEGWEPQRVEVYWIYELLVVRFYEYIIDYSDSPIEFLMGCKIEFHEREGIRIIGIRGKLYKTMDIDLGSINEKL